PNAAINLFGDGEPFGTDTVGADGTFAASVPPLTVGQRITATQTVAGVTSIPSAALMVVAVPPAPSINAPLIENSTTITGGGSSGATVEAFVDGHSVGSAAVGPTGLWTLSLG